ncbi:MAG: hypothetical protein KDE27_21895, partial [Planctomycetes bacterium]|nr:hypothetical protein [Planctomycetota bacterium]
GWHDEFGAALVALAEAGETELTDLAWRTGRELARQRSDAGELERRSTELAAELAPHGITR